MESSGLDRKSMYCCVNASSSIVSVVVGDDGVVVVVVVGVDLDEPVMVKSPDRSCVCPKEVFL